MPHERPAKPGLAERFWAACIWIPIGVAAFLILTVVALAVAWVFYLLIGLFP